MTQSVNMTSVHRDHVKHGVNSGAKSRKQQDVILPVIISAAVGVLTDIQYLILKPMLADIDIVPMILCIPTQGCCHIATIILFHRRHFDM